MRAALYDLAIVPLTASWYEAVLSRLTSRCRLLDVGIGTGGALLRHADRVRALAKACNAEALMRDQLHSRYFDAVIHATPLGMFPHTNECFFEDRIPGEIVFDMVYNPRETLLLKRAGEQNKVIIDGLQMFLEQAALQFETWTNENAPRPAMEKAALEALGLA